MKYQFAARRDRPSPRRRSTRTRPTIAAASLVIPASSGSTVPMKRLALYPPTRRRRPPPGRPRRGGDRRVVDDRGEGDEHDVAHLRRGVGEAAASTIVGVSTGAAELRARGARIPAESRPARSATPTPRRATSTVPRGAKLVKFVTSPMARRRRPSAVARLVTSIDCPSVPGRMSSTDQPSQLAIALTTTTPIANIAKSVTGWGRMLPIGFDPVQERCEDARRGTIDLLLADVGVGLLGAAPCAESSARDGIARELGRLAGTRDETPTCPPRMRSA